MPLEAHPNSPDARSQLYTRSQMDLAPGPTPTDASAEGMSDSSEATSARHDSWLIQKAQTLYTQSSDYLDANITNQWAKNLAYFRNEHAPGSQKRDKNFKRSRTFRPKTRTNVKRQEAVLAAALFSTQDIVDVQAMNPSDKNQLASAAINKELMQYRLQNTIPWFLTAVGAYQDTKVYGVCISHQYWKYQQDVQHVPALGDDGEPVTTEDESGANVPTGTRNLVVRCDQPRCDLIAPENFRFDPMCDWRDPANTSPYLIYLMPIYAGEALEMMNKQDPKTGQPVWRKHPIDAILSTQKDTFNRTRQAREGENRVDPSQYNQMDKDNTTVWAHLNIIRIEGEDIAYWTMGTELLLTSPVKLTDMYPHLREGERPFQVGFSTLEAHRNLPAGDVEQGGNLQEEVNDVANQRLDNVKLVLNKRFFVRRGAMVDLDALIRNVPGGGVMMNDPDKDVKIQDTADVTSSSYQEQDRLSAEFDSLVGNFSPNAPQNNEKSNPAVGIAKLGAQESGSIQDYSIRLFNETWTEPVLKQLVRMEQMYETDEVVMAVAAERAKLYTRFGVDAITDDLLQQNLSIKVNVGIGNTDPQTRVQKLTYGVSQVASLPGMAPRIKSTEIANEIFGCLGYKDSTRFFLSDAEAEEIKKNSPPEIPPEIQVKLKELEIRDQDNKARDAREQKKLEADIELGYAKLAMEKGIKLEALYTALGVADQKDKSFRDATALRESNKARELMIKHQQAISKANEPIKKFPSSPQ